MKTDIEHRPIIGELIDNTIYTHDGIIERKTNFEIHMKKLNDYHIEELLFWNQFEEYIKEILTGKLGTQYGVWNFIEELQKYG